MLLLLVTIYKLKWCEVCYNDSIVDSVVYNKICIADKLQLSQKKKNIYKPL